MPDKPEAVKPAEKPASNKPGKGWLQGIKESIASLVQQRKLSSEELKRGFDTVERETVNLAEQGRLYDPFAWVKHLLLWTNLQLVVLGIGCVVMTVLAYYITHRDLMVIDLTSSLRGRAYEAYKTRGADRDEFDRFVIFTLCQLHSFDYKTQPSLELLKGLVNPDIYSTVQKRYIKDRGVIQAKGIVQELHITQIDNVYPSVNGLRFSGTVRGYLNIGSVVNDRKSQQFLPYRARVVVRMQPDSIINRTGYFMTQVSEFAGEEQVRRFDAEVKADLERRGLK